MAIWSYSCPIFTNPLYLFQTTSPSLPLYQDSPLLSSFSQMLSSLSSYSQLLSSSYKSATAYRSSSWSSWSSGILRFFPGPLPDSSVQPILSLVCLLAVSCCFSRSRSALSPPLVLRDFTGSLLFLHFYSYLQSRYFNHQDHQQRLRKFFKFLVEFFLLGFSFWIKLHLKSLKSSPGQFSSI